MNELRAYPAMIEAVALEIIAINQRIADYRSAVESLNDALTCEVVYAVSPETGKPIFTNEQQRSAAIRDRQRDDPRYQALVSNIQAAEQTRAVASTKAERLRNEFSILKLEMRRELEQTIDLIDAPVRC